MTRFCEALVLLESGRYTVCGRTPVEGHHRLTRARGGAILDAFGEDYHMMDLCPKHHRMADGGDARASGLVLDGYVTTCSICQMPSYVGPDPYLNDVYGFSAHVEQHKTGLVRTHV